MKNTKKRAVKFLLAVFALISAFGAAMTVNAATPKLSAKSVTCYERGYAEITLKGVKTKDWEKGKVSIDVNNKKWQVADVYVMYGKKKSSDCVVHVYGTKKGKTTATITVKYGKNLKKQKKLKLTVKVLKFKNPVSSFKFDGKSCMSEIKQYSYAWAGSDLSGKKKISVKPAKGWKIVEITAWPYDYSKTKKIKNNSKIDTSKYCQINVTLQNTKTKGKTNVGVSWEDGRYSYEDDVDDNYEDETDGL